jgi:hypothetical protein
MDRRWGKRFNIGLLETPFLRQKNELRGEIRMESRTVSIAWKVLMIPNLMVLLIALLFVFVPDVVLRNGFQSFVGQSWEVIFSITPEIIEYISLFARMFGAHMIVIAVLAIAITLKSFRSAKRWSWYTLLVGNSFGWGSAILFDFSTGQISFVVMELVMILLVYIALGISATDILSKKLT